MISAALPAPPRTLGWQSLTKPYDETFHGMSHFIAAIHAVRYAINDASEPPFARP